MQTNDSRKRTVLPLWVRSERPRPVHVGAVLDGDYGDPALVIVDTVDHAVITTSSTVKAFKAKLQRFAHAVRA